MNKIIPVLGVPHFNRADLTARCIASIDYPVEKLVIINNGLEELKIGETEFPAGEYVFDKWKLIVVRHPNAGVAGAWNEIIKLFPAPWWLISNNDIEFVPGDLQKMADCIAGSTWENPPGVYYGNHGASWFGITARCVEKVGLFDENIYPAYLEDCDYSYRCDLLGMPRANVPDVASKHGDEKFSGSATIMSDRKARENNHRTHGRNFDYYRLKWGGTNERETFTTPFNDPHWPVWAWRFDPAMRSQNQWCLYSDPR